MKKILIILLISFAAGIFLRNYAQTGPEKKDAASANTQTSKVSGGPPSETAVNVAVPAVQPAAQPAAAIPETSGKKEEAPGFLAEIFHSISNKLGVFTETKAADKVEQIDVDEKKKDPVGYIRKSIDAWDYNTLRPCKCLDENGDTVNLGDVIARYSGKILILDLSNIDREHCQRGDDKEYFSGLMDLVGRYPDRLAVIGINTSGPISGISSYKQYYGINYEIYTVPSGQVTIDSDEKIEDTVNQFCFLKALGKGNGEGLNIDLLTQPAVIFVKDGRVVKRLESMPSPEQMETALNEIKL